MKRYLNIEFFKDLAERSVATYLQVLAALMLSDLTSVTSLGAAKAAALSAVPAALAVAKATILGAARKNGYDPATDRTNTL